MREGDVVDDRYELGPLLGRGGGGAVHRAWDRHAGVLVAVKVFTGQARRGALNEVAALRELDHPGIVALLATGPTYAVLQLVDGGSLAAAVRVGPLAPVYLAAVGARLAAALAHVHGHGLVHRDVTPSNVLLGRDGWPLLGDFGLAATVEAARVAAVGEISGTVAYMAPEQVLGGPVGPPADVWSLGLVLLEAATGHREYTGDLAVCAMARLLRDPQVPAGVPEPLAEVLTEMTAPEPAWRPSAGAACRALWRARHALRPPLREAA